MSSAPRGGHIHQDYIARIRYSNALPPPPNPPKLLDMPSTGLLDSQYTTPAFASRLAREQNLNIEADAEMGMHLDLVGLPGVFDGNDTAIETSSTAPPVDPRDAPLLRPLHTLGKPKINQGGVSFLRRTEYTAAQSGPRKTVNPFMPSNKRPAPTKRPSPEPDRDSPAYIKRKIDESFAAAKRFRDGKIRHPSRKQARLQASMPLLPNLESFPDSGAYVAIKFANNPVPKSTVYDTRMTAGILRPSARTPEEEAGYAAAVSDWEAAGQRGPEPTLPTNYDFYLADGPATAANFHKMLDLSNPDRDNQELYTNRNQSGGRMFSYQRLRAYETTKETELDHSTKYSDELLLTLSQAADGRGGKTAYYLPVMQRTALQAQRSKNIARTAGAPDERDNVIDQLDIRMHEPKPEILDAIQMYKEDPQHAAPLVEPDEEAGAGGLDARGEYNDDEDDDADADVDNDIDGPNATQVAPRDFGNYDDDDGEEEDAEGEEDEDM